MNAAGMVARAEIHPEAIGCNRERAKSAVQNDRGRPCAQSRPGQSSG